MKILFVRSALPGSILIQWGLKEDCSHVMFMFDDEFILHSSISGVEPQRWSSLKDHTTIVHEFNYYLALESEEKIYKTLITDYDSFGYDYMAFLYFAWRGILWRLFGVTFPVRNKWGKKRTLLCTGFVEKLPIFDKLKSKVSDLEMVSPHKLYQLIKDIK